MNLTRFLATVNAEVGKNLSRVSSTSGCRNTVGGNLSRVSVTVDAEVAGNPSRVSATVDAKIAGNHSRVSATGGWTEIDFFSRKLIRVNIFSPYSLFHDLRVTIGLQQLGKRRTHREGCKCRH